VTVGAVLGVVAGLMVRVRRDPAGTVLTHAGARGYLTKDAGAAEIEAAISSAASGKAHLDPDVQRRLLDALRSGTPFDVPAPATGTDRTVGAGTPVDAAPDGLTRREVDVVRQVVAGHSNAEIAASLFVSEATVKTHVNHIFAKTGVRDRAQAVVYAYENGLATSTRER
jgi:DNA-binding NarL/FixJ family response regulator